MNNTTPRESIVTVDGYILSTRETRLYESIKKAVDEYLTEDKTANQHRAESIMRVIMRFIIY